MMQESEEVCLVGKARRGRVVLGVNNGSEILVIGYYVNHIVPQYVMVFFIYKSSTLKRWFLHSQGYVDSLVNVDSVESLDIHINL